MSTKIKYALDGKKDSFLFILDVGDLMLNIQIMMDNIIHEGKVYRVLSRLSDMDENSYLILLQEVKGQQHYHQM